MPGTIARINRLTGDLYINPEVWGKLGPLHKEYILLHEQGHFDLKTPDEFRANQFAIKRFIQKAKFVDDYGHRITVMSDLLMNDNYSDFTVDAIAGAVGSVFNVLPSLGIGSKSRIAEAEANANLVKQNFIGATELQKAKTESTIYIISIISVIGIVGIILYFKIRKK